LSYSKFAVLAAAVIACVAPAQATARELVGATAKVTFVEATYMPRLIQLKFTAPLGGCAAGSILTYVAQGDDATAKAQNVQAVFSMLLTAKVSDQLVTLTVDTTDCAVVRFVSFG
jgi:hypothetical protein